jgi:hypothetical protein
MLKKILILGSFILLIVNGCSKDKSTTPEQNNNTTSPCKVISGSLIINNDTVYNSLNRFDSDGKIVRIVYYYSKNDSTVTSCFYDGDKISYTTYETDTFYYAYNKYGLVSSKITRGGSNDGRTDEFFYNEFKQVVKSKVWFLINSSKVLADSTTYTWTNDNIISSVKNYTPTFSNWITLTQNYTYDDKVNGMKVNGLPQSEFRGWSKNNLLESTVADHPELTYTIKYLEYNSSGLPTILTWQSSQSTYTSVVNYHCDYSTMIFLTEVPSAVMIRTR